MPALSTAAESGLRSIVKHAPSQVVESKLAPLVSFEADGLRLGATRATAEATAKARLEAYTAANQRLVGKYPTLDVMLRDPDAFVADLNARFAAQKKLTPGKPLRFDFSDYGLPLLKGWAGMLDGESAKLQKEISGSHLRPQAIAERRMTLAHLKDLKAEINKHRAAGSIDYQSVQELAYFTARAMGRFDTQALGKKERLLLSFDRFLQGHKKISIAEERTLFKNRQITMFDTTSPVGGFKDAHTPFENAYKNRESLGMILLPTSEPLGFDVFDRLAEYNIFLMGVTPTPLAADGFVRPSADFWVHDARHNSAIYTRRTQYDAAHHLTPAQIAALQKQGDVWQEELRAAKSKITDPELAGAVKLLGFNFHHDRGFPMVPSSFIKEDANSATPRLLYHTLRMAGQKVEFKAPKAMFDKAYAFLHDFWMPRLPEENAILAAKGGPAVRTPTVRQRTAA